MNILKRPGAEVGVEEERDGLRALQAYLHEASIMIWNNSITGMFLARENDQKYKPPSQPYAHRPEDLHATCRRDRTRQYRRERGRARDGGGN
jgi:hypothetical protein